MSVSTPIWWCIVKSEQLSLGGMFAYRIIKAVKCEVGDIDDLYRQHSDLFNAYERNQIMLFTREPEETPIEERAMNMNVPDGVIAVDLLETPPHDSWW